MGNIKNYIRQSIRILSAQADRIEKRKTESEKVQDKLYKLLESFNNGEITEEQYLTFSTDLTFANIFGDGYFFDELDRREDEWIKDAESYEKLSVDEIQKLEPIDVAKLTKDYINKKGLFEFEK